MTRTSKLYYEGKKSKKKRQLGIQVLSVFYKPQRTKSSFCHLQKEKSNFGGLIFCKYLKDFLLLKKYIYSVCINKYTTYMYKYTYRCLYMICLNTNKNLCCLRVIFCEAQSLELARYLPPGHLQPNDFLQTFQIICQNMHI